MNSNYDLRHTKTLNENTSEIDLPVVHESNSENDLTSSNSDFKQEKCKNCDNATFKCICSSDSESNEHSCADPTCDNKKAYECKHCHKRYR